MRRPAVAEDGRRSREKVDGGSTGARYEECIRVHARRKAVAEAAAHGLSAAGSTL